MLLQTFDDRIGLPARRALVVSILYQGARRILIPLSMILGTDRHGELRHTRPLFLQRFQCLQYSVCARIDQDRGAVAPGDNPVFVDDKESAFSEPLLVTVGAIGAGDRTLWFEVGGQRKVEMVILGIRSVAPGPID